MITKLEAQAGGEVEHYTEEWKFPNKDEYQWKLFAESPDGPQEVMNATFRRKG